MSKILYSDKHLQIFDDKIRFKSWAMPWGKKDVMLSHAKNVSERKLNLFSGKLRISGSGNFKDWFHFDASRPKKSTAIVIETDYAIYKRLWITPEKHDKALSILKKLI